MSTFSSAKLPTHFSRCALTGPFFKCSLKRTCKCRRVLPTWHTLQCEHVILYTSLLLRFRSIGSFSDGITVLSFFNVNITLHGTLLTTLSVHTRRMSLAYDSEHFPLYWRNIRKGYNNIEENVPKAVRCWLYLKN